MRLTSRAVHGLRVTVELARGRTGAPGRPITVAALAAASGASPGFTDDVLRQLRIGGIVRSRRGVEGGWLLARAPAEIGVADVLGAVDGPLVSIDGVAPEEVGGDHTTALLWSELRASVHRVLDGVSVADLVAGELPLRALESAAHDVAVPS